MLVLISMPKPLCQYKEVLPSCLVSHHQPDYKKKVLTCSEFWIQICCGSISAAVIEDETDLENGQSKEDDNQSDYFADAETSSCGSFELEFEWSDSEDGEGVWNNFVLFCSPDHLYVI